MGDKPKWVKVSALAKAKDISPETVWRWVDKGLVEVTREAPRTGVRVRMKPSRPAE